jgi:hypothetical protein
MFKKLRELKPQDKIKLMELKTSFKQNVTVIENDLDKKILTIEVDGVLENVDYSQIKKI